jgi:lipopolysaccharide/colanic/teichoic acid biosynthesis glycosyltransferase
MLVAGTIVIWGGALRVIDMPTGTELETACSGELGYCHHDCPVIPIPKWKRAMDIVASSFGLLILAPVFAALALCIKAVSPGPVFFTQRRVGLGGKPFTCLKFRTMHAGSDATAHQALTAQLVRGDRVMTKLDHRNDPRIIRGGAWIRKSSLDELPQLINILLGHMSLVGPRPCIPYEFERYCHCKRQRVCVTPGLTGLWQVSGKNGTTYDEMVQLDLRYSQNMTPLADVSILLKTVPTVLVQVTARPRAERAE